MILRRAVLEPFAGFTSRELVFKPGMNVVCGPNDIGKSTLFRAIDCALFLPVRLRANTVEGRELRRIIPIGGDHAHVRLELERDGKSYLLEKTWGPHPSCQLTLPDGTRLTSPERVDEELRRLFPIPPGTFRSVLLVGQSQLEGTLDALARSSEPLHTLGDALRVAVNRTDGVSVDRLKTSLAARLDQVFLNWDRTLDAPRKGRGVENPWDRQGSLLRAWYEHELARRHLAETQALETELGEATRRLGEKLARQEELRKFVAANEKLVDGASARQALELRRSRAESEAQALMRDLNQWIQAEAERKVLEPDVARLDGIAQVLAQELREARAATGRQAAAQRLARIEAAQRDLEEQRKRLQETPAVRPEDLQRLRQGRQAIETARASLSAARLEVLFTARTAMDVVVARDLEKEKKEALAPGDPLQLQAGGKIRLSTEYFDLTVTSGDGRMARLEEQLRRDSESVRRLFAELGIRSLEEAQEREARWLAASQAVRVSEAALQALLGGTRPEVHAALQAELRAQSLKEDARPPRDPEQIERDCAAAHQQLSNRKADLAACLRASQDLARRHAVPDSAALTALLLKKGVEQETFRGQLDALPPLPEGIQGEHGIGEFVARFRSSQRELLALGEELRALSNAVVELKAKLPSQSAQDFDRQHREAAAAWERERARGRALARVAGTMEAIEAQGSDIYQGFRLGLEDAVRTLSEGKYSEAKLQGPLPTEFARRDGARVPYEWLSWGTRDGFALALRLHMARHFLSEGQGFLLLDDPMVAMDPARQQAAAGILQDFAGRAQLIVFTCHPSHAKLLGGHQPAL